MKIIYYSSHPQLRLKAHSGPGTHMRETISAIKALGHEVYPVILGDELSASTTGGGGIVKPSPLRTLIKRFIPGIIWRTLKEIQLLRTDELAAGLLARKIDEIKPDFVYERGAYLQLSGVRTVRAKGITHFMELNAPFIDEVREFEQARTLLIRKARYSEKMQVQSPDLVYVVSSALKDYYSSFTSQSEKIRVVPNSVNPGYLKVDLATRNNLMNEFRLHNKKIIGFVGSIFPYHGVDILIRAFSSIAKEFPEAVLLIVGDGIILNELKELSRHEKMEERILFAGSRPHNEVFTWIDLMDICVMAKSNWYGSPVKIFEYGAMGKGIIAPDTIPVNDVMKNNVDGLLIKPADGELKEALRTFLIDDTLKETLAANFKNKVLAEYTWKKTAEKIVGDYNQLKTQ
jgi:glycosyltransferase involved in cell wall biosynthesis